jgi:hypothetical protein
VYSYEVKVRGTTHALYLWGSAGITADLTWPLLLTIRNDIVGDPVMLGTERGRGHKTTIGTLQPGECYTLSLLGIHGVFATCKTDSNLACTILVPQLGPAA